MTKILIVEDEEVLLNILKNKLQKEGYLVVTAKDGKEGLKVMKAAEPDLVLLDILMPKMTGMQVLEEMNKEGLIHKYPVIIISNSGQPVEIDKARQLGVSDYLVKAEFDPDEVLEKIENVLSYQVRPKDEIRNKTKKSDSNEIVKKTAKKSINPKDFSVLVVEDDRFLRDLMVRKIQKEGFEVYDALDGEMGLQQAKEKKPHIILLDLILPGMDGFEVLKELKSYGPTANIPVVILSNLGQKDDIDKGISMGAKDYLIKAHNTPGEIVDKIKEVLSDTY